MRFPCIALITVVSVDFDELTAEVDVLSVQHESVCLPERVVDVPLIELWPTEKQREKSVNAEGTAEFIDLMRSVYKLKLLLHSFLQCFSGSWFFAFIF